MVKKYLDLKKVQYEAIDVTDDHETRDKVIKESGYRTVPVITDGERYLAGWNPTALAKMIA